MTTHEVFIVKKKESRRPVRVTNPHLVVKIGDKVNFVAKNTEAVLFFPEKKLFGKRIYELNSGNSYKEELEVAAKALKGDEHDYAIWVKADGDFVDVGSYPSIIID